MTWDHTTITPPPLPVHHFCCVGGPLDGPSLAGLCEVRHFVALLHRDWPTKSRLPTSMGWRLVRQPLLRHSSTSSASLSSLPVVRLLPRNNLLQDNYLLGGYAEKNHVRPQRCLCNRVRELELLPQINSQLPIVRCCQQARGGVTGVYC